jgi:hypothetical protein
MSFEVLLVEESYKGGFKFGGPKGLRLYSGGFLFGSTKGLKPYLGFFGFEVLW